MVTPRTILVPYDFTAASKRACDYAIALAAAVGARLRLVHVLEHVGSAITPTAHAKLTASVEKKLDRAATLVRASVPAVPVETCLVEGSPWAGIEAVARDGGADLIVMGTHGRRGFARTLLGSVDSRAVRMSTVPVTTVPEYVAVSRRAAGMRLADELSRFELQSPNVVALSRGALTVATAVAERTAGSVDLWAVEPISRDDGVVIGAIGEDGLVMYDAGASELSDGGADGDARLRHRGRGREEGVLGARRRLSSELVALKGARSIGECWQLDVVLVADGLFSSSIANVAIAALHKLGPRRMIVATPVIARSVRQHLEAKRPLVDAVVSLETAILADTCTYRDDVLPSDVVAYELILASHADAG
jgi:nucleotide-binding universal stress UspA family protein/predicted phosphoribosyltransferase